MRAVGRTSMTSSYLLVLAEPAEGLPRMVRAESWMAGCERKAETLSTIVVEKNLGPLCNLADRHFVLEKGRVVRAGDSDALHTVPRVAHYFLGVWSLPGKRVALLPDPNGGETHELHSE